MFVKVFDDILMSSIWDEDVETRLFWIALLVLADQNGYVRGTPQALARLANLDVAAVEKALEILSTPDSRSRTKENEGRRLAVAPGGYVILNYPKYRAIRTASERRAYMRDYMAARREAEKQVSVPGDDPPEPPSAESPSNGPVTDPERDLKHCEICPPEMLAKLAEEAMKVYGSDFAVADFLETFVYPPDSHISAADLLDAIHETGLAGVRAPNWTRAKLRGWHAAGGRPGGARKEDSMMDAWRKAADGG